MYTKYNNYVLKVCFRFRVVHCEKSSVHIFGDFYGSFCNRKSRGTEL